MSDSTMYVGLDYHDQSVQVCVMASTGRVVWNGAVSNSADRIARRVGLGVVVHAAIEACNGAAVLAEQLIAEYGWSVSLAHAGYVHRLKQSPDKTDYSDARLLADLMRVGYLPRVWLPPAEIRQLRRLMRYRQSLANERRATKQRIGGWLRSLHLRGPSDCGRWTQRWRAAVRDQAELSESDRWLIGDALDGLSVIEARVKQVEQRIETTLACHPVAQRLLAIVGVGLVTAGNLTAEIGRFDRFANGKQLARYCGLSPRNVSSGQRQADGGLVQAANPELRVILIEAAWQIIRRHDRWRALADQLTARGKPRAVVGAAVANRWVRWLHHQMLPTIQAA